MTGTRSYAYGQQPAELLGETIGDCLARIARTYPNQEAVVSCHQNRRMTYQEFQVAVDRAARALLGMDVQPGDRVAIWSVNNIEWVIMQFATARIGAVLVNINPSYRTHELAFALRASKTKLIFMAEAFKKSRFVEMFLEICPEAYSDGDEPIRSVSFPHLKHAVVFTEAAINGLMTFESFLTQSQRISDERFEHMIEQLDIDDVINIQYTSGTTGTPKGVQLTHNNILNNGLMVGHGMNLTSEDRVCVPVPFYHCFGMVVSNLAAMTHGAAIIIPSPVFDVEATLRAVQNEKCTVLHGVPTMFIAELDHPDFNTFDVSTLRTGIMAGAPCPVELMRRVVSDLNMHDVLIGYGMTESSPVSTMTAVEDSFEKRVETVGRVMPGQEIKIIDPATGQTVPRGTSGEVCFRGYHVMIGYDHELDATHEAIDDNRWLHSGDIGVMDDEGYVKICGRIKEMVIRGGENIYPREIEEFLHTLPDIADAYVVGVPDPKFGEELCACVRLKEGTPKVDMESLRATCQGKIAHFKIPKYWLEVEEYPLTVTGKIQKFKLREVAMAQLALIDRKSDIHHQMV